MSILVALLWAAGITFLWFLGMSLLVALRGPSAADTLTSVLFEIAAYGFGLFLVLRVHGPEATVRDFIAVRRAHPAFFVLGGVLGVALNLPADWLKGFVLEQFPPSVPEVKLYELLADTGTVERVLIALALAVAVPAVEEALFRGALFGRLRQQATPLVTIAWTSVCFAAAHIDPRIMIPILPVALCLGFVRWASGSLLSAILVHVGFNTVPLALVWTLPQETLDAPTPTSWLAASLATAIGALLAVGWLGRREHAAGRVLP